MGQGPPALLITVFRSISGSSCFYVTVDSYLKGIFAFCFRVIVWHWLFAYLLLEDIIYLLRTDLLGPRVSLFGFFDLAVRIGLGPGPCGGKLVQSVKGCVKCLEVGASIGTNRVSDRKDKGMYE